MMKGCRRKFLDQPRNFYIHFDLEIWEIQRKLMGNLEENLQKNTKKISKKNLKSK